MHGRQQAKLIELNKVDELSAHQERDALICGASNETKGILEQVSYVKSTWMVARFFNFNATEASSEERMVNEFMQKAKEQLMPK